MFGACEKLAGRRYTLAAALLLAAPLGPIGLLATAPNGVVMVSLTLLGSALCLRLAWVQSIRHTAVTVPSLNLR